MFTECVHAILKN